LAAGWVVVAGVAAGGTVKRMESLGTLWAPPFTACTISSSVVPAVTGFVRAVGSVERAERNVSLDNIEQLALALGVDISTLLGPG
jgi:uncharacterized membrane protein